MTKECVTSPSQHLSTFTKSLFPGFLAHHIMGTGGSGSSPDASGRLGFGSGLKLFLCEFDQTSKTLSSSLKWE